MLEAVHECSPSFVHSVRARSAALDKRLEMKFDELNDTAKALGVAVQQSFAGDQSAEFLEGSLSAVWRLLTNTNALLDVSCVIAASSLSDSLRCLEKSSHVQTGIDPASCKASHDPWLMRGQCNTVTITLHDAGGEPVYGMTPMDVVATVNRDAVGWAVVSTSVEGNMLSVGVRLEPECSPVAVLLVNYGSTELPLRLKVRVHLKRVWSTVTFAFCMTFQVHVQAAASPEAVTSARSLCQRVLSNHRDHVEVESLTSRLLSECTAALSSPEVAEDFCYAIAAACSGSAAIRETLGAAGVIDAVVEMMGLHGLTSADVASRGCFALCNLAAGHPADAQAIVCSRGLALILSAMTSHPGDGMVQCDACMALQSIADFGGPAAKRVIRDSAAVELLNAAKRTHSNDEDVLGVAEGALRELLGQDPSSNDVTDVEDD